jgi:hypothetical protein
MGREKGSELMPGTINLTMAVLDSCTMDLTLGDAPEPASWKPVGVFFLKSNNPTNQQSNATLFVFNVLPLKR